MSEYELISGQLAGANKFKILVDGKIDTKDIRQIIKLLNEKMVDMSEDHDGDALDHLVSNEDD